MDRIVGLDGVRSDIAMMRTPDGHSRLELDEVPDAPGGQRGTKAPINTFGIGRMMYAVDDIDDVVARLQGIGGELRRRSGAVRGRYRLCYLRGPEGIIIALAEPLS